MQSTFYLSNKFIKTLILLLVTTFLSACNISGSVILDGSGLADVTVVLSNGAMQRTATTNVNGEFSFSDIPDGDYEVSVQPPAGYAGVATIPVTKAGDVNNINFVMLSETLRSTNTGNVIGFAEDNGIHTWRGIPFAKPPIDALRWRAPLPADSWGNEAYLALQSKEVCVEPVGELVPGQSETAALTKGTEDCLYLDVQAPAFSVGAVPQGSDRKPVLVWIYGGGNVVTFTDGQDGKNLVKDHDMVVVRFNYRVGHLGWFSHPALETGDAYDDSGNYGTLDIISVLRWVQDNIEHFGGDPSNVTIGGVSAGGFNVYSLLLSQEASGLFHKAISQSGYITTYDMETVQNYQEEGGYFNSSREVLNNLLVQDGLAADRVAAKAYQNGMTDNAIREYLYSKTPEEILNAGKGPKIQPHNSTMKEPGYFSVATKFRDGVVLPAGDPLTLFEDTQAYNAVPLLTGVTRDESKPFVAFDPDFVHLLAGLPVGSKDRDYYNLFNGYKSDFFRIKGVDSIAEVISQNQNQPDVFTYRFDWDNSPTIIIADLPHLIGAAHALDVKFSFNHTDEPGDDFFSTYFFTDQNAADRRGLAGSMSSYWAEFIHTGDPGNGRLGTESVTWLPWTNAPGTPNIMILDGVEDAGISMNSSRLSFDGLKQRLFVETGFPSQEKHCSMYEELFNRSIYWDAQEYQNLGAAGCNAFPVAGTTH